MVTRSGDLFCGDFPRVSLRPRVGPGSHPPCGGGGGFHAVPRRAAVGFSDYNFSYDSAGVDSDHDSTEVNWFVFAHLEVIDNLLLGVDWALSWGWHFYLQDFNRSNFTLDPITFGIAFQPASEDHRGSGPKIGIRFDANPYPSWSLRVAADWIRIIDAEAQNRALGTTDSEGNSIRWRVNLGYHISKNVDIGVSYRGMVLDVDQDRSASLVIPNNKTEM